MRSLLSRAVLGALPMAAVVLAAGCAAPSPPSPPEPASVVLITVDTLRADHLSPYGAAVDTPAAERLAVDGVLFEQAAAPCPLTLPSHVTLFTGLEPYAHGVRDNAGFRLGATDSPITGAGRGAPLGSSPARAAEVG